MNPVVRPRSDQRKGLAGIHLAVFLFGFAGLFPRWIALPSVAIVFGRTFFAALALGAWTRPFSRKTGLPGRADSLLLVISGAVLAFHWASFFQSVKVSTVAVALLSYSCFPVFVVLAEPLIFRERFRSRNLLFALIALFGVFWIIPGTGWSDPGFQGILWGLASGLTFAVLMLINRRLSACLPATVIAFFQDLVATIALAPFLILARPRVTPIHVALLVILGVLCTAVAHTLFIRGIQRVSAQIAGILALGESLYGIILAYLLLGEIPAIRTVVGGAIILAVALMVTATADR
jgi:drug/metabolite transporter (DMT)-like permease